MIASLLEQAGESKNDSRRFILKRRVYCIVAGVCGLFLAVLGLPIYLSVTFAIAGYIFPLFQLKKRIARRQREIVLTIPYYLDVLTLALEAGLDLIASIEELVQRDRTNPFRDELLLTLKSIQLGETRSEAFRRLASRTGLEPLAFLSSCITQSEELGSSLGSLLRLQADALRREIFKQAEERAQRAPVKMLLPLIGLIFPVVFLLLFGPIFMMMAKV